MGKSYFFRTHFVGGRNRLRALEGQTFGDTLEPINPAFNVSSDKTIRARYPVGTVFGSFILTDRGSFYEAGQLFVLDTEPIEDTHRPPADLVEAYRMFKEGVTVTSHSSTREGESSKEARVATPKKTLLEKITSNPALKAPNIMKEGFYVSDDSWNLLVRNITNNVNTMLIGPTGTGKCLGKDTPVLMYDGTIKMVQDVVVGDKLMGPDSKPRNVLSVTSGREELFRVTPKKGDSWVCNKSHILSLKRTNDGTSLAGTVCNVGITEYLGWSKSHKHIYKQWRSAVDFPEKELSLDPYFLGVWLGDGRTDSPTICTPDRPIVHYLRDYAWSIGCTLSLYQEPSKANSYRIAQKDAHDVRKRTNIQQRMDNYNLFGNKHIPNDFLYNSRENRLRLFAGLMDTDGSYSHGYFEYSTKLDNLKDEIVYLGRSLGYYARVSKRKVKGNDYWRIGFSGDFSDVPTRIKRKQASVRVQKKDVLVTSISVKSIGEGDYYGFTIDGDHLFLLGDFTVTHNTELVLKACKKLGKKCHVYDMGSMYDPVAGLLGVHRLQKGGVSTFDYAKFTQDIQEPGVVLLDELSRAPVTTNNILFPCLDSRRSLPVEIAGGDDLRTIKVHEDCCFIATANVGAEYTGTMSMDRALTCRFFPIELSYLPIDIETGLLRKRCLIQESVAKNIAYIANKVRTMYMQQEVSSAVSTRETLMVGDLIADGWTPTRAMELVFLPLFEGSMMEGERSIIAKVIMSK